MQNNKRKQLYTAITLIISMGSAMAQFAPEIELADIGVTGAGFVLNGVASTDGSGRTVSVAGDINGDGIDDLIIGASGADPNGSGSGASYVVFGKVSGFDPSLNLADLNGSNGFVLNGVDVGDLSGYSVNEAGDINGDGLDDLIIGAFGADSNGGSSGASYVVFGKSSGFGASLELADLNGSNGFVLNGVDAGDSAGRSVSAAGDINGDDIDDLIIGASGADPNGSGSGASYVVFGKDSGFDVSFELSSLAMGDGSDGFVLNGVDVGDSAGGSVSAAGDINGDGLDDLIIGASGADSNGGNSGASYVVFGKDSGFDPSLNLADLNGSNGFVLNGVSAFDGSGASVSAAGDINGDGIDDLIIGAANAVPNGNNSGASYVVFGKSSGFGATLELADLNGTDGFVINGVASGDLSGYSVNEAGDINGDGVDDVIIGALRAEPNGSDSGASYVVFGDESGFGASLELADLNGSNGFVLKGVAEFDGSGRSVSAAGDINGDDIDDLIIGASGADPNGSGSGASYVVFGSFPCQADGGEYLISTAAQLNHAIGCANAESLADTVKLTTDITLRTTYDTSDVTIPFNIGKTGLAAITSAMTIDGQGYRLQRDETLSCDLNGVVDEGEFRLLRTSPGADLTLQNMVLANGCADDDGNNVHKGIGGAVYHESGTLNLSNIHLANNKSLNAGGGIYLLDTNSVVNSVSSSTFSFNTSARGGAIYSNGVISEIINTTFSANAADGFDGGAIWSLNTTNINHVTFSQNQASSLGGAIFINGGTMTINNSLFHNNSASGFADCALGGGSVSGVFFSNMADGDDSNCEVTPGFDVISETDLVTSTVLPLADNGCVMPLADGSCVPTLALTSNSQAVDAFPSAVSDDQRGFLVQNQGDRDIGAFEFNGINPDVIFKDGFE
jgi:hypothetical protein